MALDQFWGKDAGGTWRRALPLYVKDAGVWQRAKTAWVKVAGTWQQVYGDSLHLTASGTVIGANSWTFNYGVFADSGNTVEGGGVGTVVTLEVEVSSLIYGTYTDVGGSGNTAPVDVDETVAYRARLYDKAGAEVDSVVFTPA
jgi:hypothetical protein